MSEIQNMKSTKTSILACYGLIGLIVLMVIAYVSKMSSAVSAISDMNTQNISIVAIAFWSSVIIGISFFHALVHGLGFRIFTIYSKESRPQMSWRMLIQLVTFITSAAIFWCIEYLFINSPSLDDLSYFIFNSAWIMVGFILLTVLTFFIAMTVTAKILLPIDFITSIKSSILNVIVLLILLAPFIIYFSVMGSALSKGNSQIQKKSELNNSEIPNPSMESKYAKYIGIYPGDFLSDRNNWSLISPTMDGLQLKSINSEYFGVVTPIMKEGKFIIGEGCKSHDCTSKNAIFYLNTENNFFVLFTNDTTSSLMTVYCDKCSGLKKSQNGYSFDYPIPNEVKKWLRERNFNLN